MTFTRRLMDCVTFKMHTWHTVHGESIVEVSVRLLGVVFADFTRPTRFSKILSIFICRFTSVVVTGLFLADVVHAKGVGDFAKVAEGVMVGIQTTNDQIFGIGLMYAKLARLYHKRKNFWSRKDVDPEDTCNDTKKQKFTLIFGNIFLVLLYTAYFCFILSYFLFGKLGIWVPESRPKIDLALSVYAMTWGIFSVSGSGIFNLLIVSLCVEVQVQFQLINYRLSKMEVTFQGDNCKEAAVKEIKSIVQHHIFLLEYWKELRQILSLLSLIRIFQAVCVLCMGIFIVTADQTTSLYDAVRSILINGCLVLQLMFMVFSSETVESESSKVFDAAYTTPWNKVTEIAPYIKILMLRTMSPCNLTAGGLVEINKPLMTAIIKTTFSYYAAMKTMAGLD